MNFTKEKYNVLNNGFIELVDYMGCECSILQSARVSYSNDVQCNQHNSRECLGVSSVKDIALLEFLIKHKHLSPFESCIVKWHIKAPMFVIKQILRHRTGSFNELSLRYKEAISDYYCPDSDDVKIGTSIRNKAFKAELGVAQDFRNIVTKNTEFIFDKYNYLLNEMHICKEQSRMILPHNIFSRLYMTMDLRNLLHFINLRAQKDAQFEIRVYAIKMLEILSIKYPNIVKLFNNYIYFAKNIPADIIKKIINNKKILEGLNELINNESEKYSRDIRNIFDLNNE